MKTSEDFCAREASMFVSVRVSVSGRSERCQATGPVSWARADNLQTPNSRVTREAFCSHLGFSCDRLSKIRAYVGTSRITPLPRTIRAVHISATGRSLDR